MRKNSFSGNDLLLRSSTQKKIINLHVQSLLASYAVTTDGVEQYYNTST